jgi:hypothetical protein
VLDLTKLDLDEIAEALADKTDYEHLRLIDPRTGDIAFWTSDTGIDGHTPVELDDLDLLPIEPLPSHVWYRDMAEFAEGISDEHVGRRLARAIEGRGAFRRFKDELHDGYPQLLPAWYAFRDARAKRRAVEWLMDNSLIDNDSANHCRASALSRWVGDEHGSFIRTYVKRVIVLDPNRGRGKLPARISHGQNVWVD